VIMRMRLFQLGILGQISRSNQAASALLSSVVCHLNLDLAKIVYVFAKTVKLLDFAMERGVAAESR